MTTTDAQQRRRLEIGGAVQGVGFRPFVYRLSRELGLAGWVRNDSRGVTIEAEGSLAALDRFAERLRAEAPAAAVVLSWQETPLEPTGESGFTIHHSAEAGAKSAVLLPDLATCPACLAELRDPDDRRFRYPFLNCTDCGPRFSIIEALPYDRPATTMKRFAMCAACRAEYEEPADRRFHAQPNACPACGPALRFVAGAGAGAGEASLHENEALVAAAAAIRSGEIVAVKGIGGFHLVVRAGDDAAVDRLRRRKARYEKPLALMVPDLEAARELCVVGRDEAALLASPAAPIVLLDRRPDAPIAPAVAPGNPRLGLMLPYSPLHHLLLGAVGEPVVATSGNLSDEPICTDDHEAVRRLAGIADAFLLHDRPIARHVDDSVVALACGRPLPIRRARGLAPLPIVLPAPGPAVLAVGAHLKNAVALSLGDRAYVSQHIGDMETAQSLDAFERVIGDFLEMYDARPAWLAHDLHPDYSTTRWARSRGGGGETAPDWRARLAAATPLAVQHHHAHLASCLADHDATGRALGVTFDGTGYGPDGTVWGGELLLGDASGYQRVARLSPFLLPGGEAAVREPRRVALALLWKLYGDETWRYADLPTIGAFGEGERPLFSRLLSTGFRSPTTSSAGRLFDGVASLLGLRQRVAFEGQAAMLLEHLAGDATGAEPYPMPIVERGDDPPLELDWRPTIEALVTSSRRGDDPAIMAGRFHATLAEAVAAVAGRVGEPRVALTGGCFQNRLLTELCRRRLESAGFEVLQHRQVPPNDGGICLGQVAVAVAAAHTEGG